MYLFLRLREREEVFCASIQSSKQQHVTDETVCLILMNAVPQSEPEICQTLSVISQVPERQTC